MKKSYRIVALLICAVMLCSTLCSCQLLDELRQNRAVISGEDTFTFRDNTYKRMKLNSDLSFIMNETVSTPLYLTDADVPILLSPYFSDSMFYDRSGGDDPVVIEVSNEYQNMLNLSFSSDRISAALTDDLDGYEHFEYKTEYYVREDQYDKIKKIIDGAKLDHRYIIVYEETQDEKGWYTGNDRNVLLDDATNDAINKTLADGEKATLNDLDDSGAWATIGIFTCDKDITLTNSAGDLNLLTDSFDYYLYYDYDTTTLYKVSDKYFEHFRSIYSMCKDDLSYFGLENLRSMISDGYYESSGSSDFYY